MLEKRAGKGHERERGIKGGDGVAVVEEEATGIARATAGIEDVGWWREDAGEVAIPRHCVRVVRVHDERRRMALVVLDGVRIPRLAEWCCWHHDVTTLGAWRVRWFGRRAAQRLGLQPPAPDQTSIDRF